MKISALEIIDLIEPHFRDCLEREEYEIKTIKAEDLLTYNRFDIAFKLLYLEMLNYDVEFAKENYQEHIRAFSLGNFKEPGNAKKNSINQFLKVFHEVFKDIKVNGFNQNKTLIPLSKNNSIVNGAHRVASAIYLNKTIDCIEIGVEDDIYNYRFFYNRKVSNGILDIVAIKFIEYASNVHIAFFWPIEKNIDIDVESMLPNIVYTKKIQLNFNGAHNLLSQIYYGEEWLGSVEENFPGSMGKMTECFKTFDAFQIVAFQSNDLNEVLKIKENIRSVFSVGKHSIHITDTKEEAVRMARVVFNENSVHFLNYAKPNKYLSFHRQVNSFKNFIRENNINSDKAILDEGIVLSAYGLRESANVKHFTIEEGQIGKCYSKVLDFHHEKRLELIFNPKFYFFFNNIKFIAFNQLYRMKKNRGKKKDINDCKMMESLLKDDNFKKLATHFKQTMLYGRVKFRYKLILLLKFVGLYNIIKTLKAWIRL